MKTFWLVELRPALPSLPPPQQPTYYAGYALTPSEMASTTDPYAAPRWVRKEDAELVAKNLLGTKSCMWEAIEHGFMEPRDCYHDVVCHAV